MNSSEARVEISSHEVTAAHPALINHIQDTDTTFWKDMRNGALKGVEASLIDVEGQAVRGGTMAAIGYGTAALGSVYSPFKGAVPLIVGAAVITTAISHHFQKSENSDTHANVRELAAEAMAKFGADVATSAGIGLLAGKLKWNAKGADHAEWIVSREVESIYYPAAKGMRARTVPAHFTHRGLTLEEKSADLTTFLKARREPEKFPTLFERMKELHKPELEGKEWMRRARRF